MYINFVSKHKQYIDTIDKNPLIQPCVRKHIFCLLFNIYHHFILSKQKLKTVLINHIHLNNKNVVYIFRGYLEIFHIQ